MQSFLECAYRNLDGMCQSRVVSWYNQETEAQQGILIYTKFILIHGSAH